jgi:acyl-coenzyme A thioesterase PaaI-like protein
MIPDATEASALQDRYAPNGVCFGCGPANAKGLRIKSRLGEDGAVVCDWQPRPEHEAFAGVLSGGIIGTLLDCHCNWTAAQHLMRAAGEAKPPSTVTAEYHIKLLRPTPTDGPVHLSARVVDAAEGRAVVEGTLAAGGKTCATCRGVFVAVGPGHPAYHRWE